MKKKMLEKKDRAGVDRFGVRQRDTHIEKRK